MKRSKRVPVRTETHDEDDTLRLAHLFKKIQRRAGHHWVSVLIVRALAFNGSCVVVSDAKRMVEP